MIPTIIILITVLLSVAALFFYVRHSINTKVRDFNYTENVARDIQDLKISLEQVRDQAYAVENFSNKIYQDTDRKINQLQQQNDMLAERHDVWKGIYTQATQVLGELNSNQKNYEHLLALINKAEQHEDVLHREITHAESTRNEVHVMSETMNGALEQMNQKSELIARDVNRFTEDFSERTQQIQKSMLDNITRELDTLRQSKFHAVSTDLSNVYTDYKNKSDALQSKIQSHSVHVERNVDNMFSTYHARIDDLRDSLHEENKNIEHTISEGFSSYTKQVSELQSVITENFNEQEQMLNNRLNEYTDKIMTLGEDSYLELDGKVDAKKTSLDMKISSWDDRVHKKMGDIEQHSLEQYEKVNNKINILTSAVNNAEQRALSKIEQIDGHIGDVNDKIRRDYQILEQDHAKLEEKIKEMQNEYQELEEQVRNQIATKHQEIVSDLINYISNIKQEVENQTNTQLHTLETLYSDSQDSTQQEIETLKQKFVVGTQRSIEEFDGMFKSVTQEVWNKLGEYEKTVDAHFADNKNHMVAQIASFSQQFDTQLEEKDVHIEKELGKLGKVFEKQCDYFSRDMKKIEEKFYDDYVSKIQTQNQFFDEEIQVISDKVDNLKQDGQENHKTLQNEFSEIRRDAERQREDYQKFLGNIKNTNNILKQEIAIAQERYGDFNGKHKEIVDNIEMLSEEKHMLDKRMVETDNVKGTVTSLYTEYNVMKKDIELSKIQMKDIKNEMKESIGEHKRSLKSIEQIDSKIQKSTRHMGMIDQQNNKIESIKNQLSDIKEKQGKVSDYQKELNSWDKDYKLLIESVDGLQSRNTKIQEHTHKVEGKLKVLEGKTRSMDTSLSQLNNKYETAGIDDIEKNVQTISSSMPSIMNNISEFKEMQQRALERDADLQKTISEAEKKLVVMGQVLNQEGGTRSTLAKGRNSSRETDASTRLVQRTVYDLYTKQHWTEENIAQTLKISVAEVKLILQKSTIS